MKLKEVYQRIQEGETSRKIGVTVLERPDEILQSAQNSHLKREIDINKVPFLPDEIGFWRDLKRNVESFPTSNQAFGSFLKFYDRRRGRIVYDYNSAYYGNLFQTFEENIRQNLGQPDLEDYLTTEFSPPQEDSEFNKLVSDTREAISRTFRHKPDVVSDSVAQLSNPLFWRGVYEDLGSANSNVSFSTFLQFYRSEESTSYSGSGGKYKTIHTLMYNFDYRARFERLFNRGNQEPRSFTTAADVQRVFYELAPLEVQLLLSERFPKIFKEIGVGEAERRQLLPSEVLSFVDAISWLGEDSRDRIQEALASYVSSKKAQEGNQSLSESEIKSLLEQTSSQTRREGQKLGQPRLEDIIRDTKDLFVALRKSEAGDSETAGVARELLNALEDSYYFPLLKSTLYKPAALFWSAYRKEYPEVEVVPSEALTDFLEKHVEGRVGELTDTDEIQVIDHLKSKVLPNVFEYFSEISRFAPQVSYFRKTDSAGNPKSLFFHQIEGVKILMERKGGILADEPGTGKTVILALAALNLLDQREATKNGIGRILVVGSKKVIDNWQGELDVHIETDGVDVVNLNFTEETGESESGLTVKQRLAMLEEKLRFPSGKRQIALVNYDIFRNQAFQRILNQYDFHAAEVDEAHNVKSRFLTAINTAVVDPKKSVVAQRTRGLYKFLKTTDMPVFLATSTPFVKDLVEPLIMAHLVKGEDLPESKIKALRSDPVGTNRILREVMVRRKKEEIADLPPKETTFIPIDLNSLSVEDKARFREVSDELDTRHERALAHFYAQLSLEAQAKYPWLINKVNEIISDGRKVVIFTPFVTGENRLTSAISTEAVASRLYQAGITSVGILDGALDDASRTAVEKDFHRKEGIKVLVGNYMTAGESITLNSPENRATEVIIFVGPNAISRYIQAVDRIHRFGQEEKVTIHVPYVTGDLLNRAFGTYDERVVQRLISELSTFTAVVDGLFFMESNDFYLDITKQNMTKVSGPISFNKTIENQGIRKTRTPFSFREEGNLGEEIEVLDPDVLDSMTFEDPYTSGKSDLEEEQAGGGELDFSWMRSDMGKNRAQDKDLSDLANIYFSQIKMYPLLTGEQEGLIFEHLRNGGTVDALKSDERFGSTVSDETREKMANLLRDSKTLTEVMVNSNLRLVASVAYKYKGRMPLLDLVQEGSTGLMRSIEKFDHKRDFKFSTYATWWIRQAIARGIADKSRSIRLPVHMHESVSKLRVITTQFYSEYGHNPTIDELKNFAEGKGRMTKNALDSAIKVIQSGVMSTASLDAQIGRDEDSVLTDVVPDRSVNVEGTVLDAVYDDDLKAEVRRALEEGLAERERKILELRFGLVDGEEKTLEQVGREFGITRERVRQLQEVSLARLRVDKNLWERWKDEMPAYAYRLSAEETAIRMGLFAQKKTKSKKGEERVSEEPLGSTDKAVANQLIMAAAIRIVENARQETDIWSQIPERERSILALYFKKGTSRNVAKERLATIFKLSPTEVDEIIKDSVENLAGLIGMNPETGRRRQFRSVMLDELVSDLVHNEPGLTNGEIASQVSDMLRREVPVSTIVNSRERLKKRGVIAKRPSIETLVERIVTTEPLLSNREIASKVSKELKREVPVSLVYRAKTNLRYQDRLERPLKSEEFVLLDDQVEELIKQGKTYKEIADDLDQPVGRISSSAARLRKAGRVEAKVYDRNTFEAVGEYLKNADGDVPNFAEIGREVGVSRERVRQLVYKIEAAQ